MRTTLMARLLVVLALFGLGFGAQRTPLAEFFTNAG